MVIPATIEVITVVSKDAQVVYQNVHANDHEAAEREYNGLFTVWASLLRDGGTITRRRF